MDCNKIKDRIISFNESLFYKNSLNNTFEKRMVELSIYLTLASENMDEFSLTGSIILELKVGIDKLYSVKDITQFFESINNNTDIYFGKKFIFMPSKMCFNDGSTKLLDCIIKLYDKDNNDMLHKHLILIKNQQVEEFLNLLFDYKDTLNFDKEDHIYSFSNDVDLSLNISDSNDEFILEIDYSKYDNFVPLTPNYKFIYSEKLNQISKIPDEKTDIIKNIYKFKNDELVVRFKIDEKGKKLFIGNFYNKYKNTLAIKLSEKTKMLFDKYSLVSNIYLDLASEGISCKAEFCYGENVINPLRNDVRDHYRNFEKERQILLELRNLGFREKGKLFYLNDIELIVQLLTNNLYRLKLLSNIYYSEDFRMLKVKNLSDIDMVIKSSEDDSVLHMSIHLENITDEELIELLKSLKNNKKYIRLKFGSIIRVDDEVGSRIRTLFNALDIDINNIQNGQIEIPRNKSIFIDKYLENEGIKNIQLDDNVRNISKSILNSNNSEVEFDDFLLKTLRQYQTSGVKWLKSLAVNSFGGILADDMGLGKTIQVLSFISSDMNRKKSCLVIAPTSIIYNWAAEVEKFTPSLKTMVISGSKEKRLQQLKFSNNFDILVTSYASLRNDIKEYMNLDFSYVFLDEAQNIKNHKTINANAAKSLHANCCFALTGTPIENNIIELWSIFDFIMPGYLSSKNNFSKNFEIPIVKENDTKALDKLSKMTKPFILRRLKKDVLTELPERIETNCFSDMTHEQSKLYAAYYKTAKKEIMESIEHTKIGENSINIFTALTRLRQICADPRTFISDYSGGSGKFEQSIELINESIESGHSLLLFSQFTKMLKIIRKELEINSVRYYYLDGTIEAKERIEIVNKFNNDEKSIFLISLKAGGTGLNLTKADIVINYDPWWNPATEDQAMSRAHRIGQKNVVQVFKLITKGTIEEKILNLQEKKKNLLNTFIETGENFINNLTESEIRELFEINL